MQKRPCPRRSDAAHSWQCILESHSLVDSVLRFEAELSKEFSSDIKFSFERRGNISVRVYSWRFSEAYFEKLNHQQERRIRSAILRVGSFWYTAWVLAGKPSVESLLGETISPEKEKIIKRLRIEDREAQSCVRFPLEHFGLIPERILREVTHNFVT